MAPSGLESVTMHIKTWTTHVYVLDDYLTNTTLINQLKHESTIQTTVEGQDHSNQSDAQKELLRHVTPIVITYCEELGIDFNNLEFTNMQKGHLHRYDSDSVHQHLYEPHHDMVERGYITALYYVDSDYSDDKWVGGELTLYKDLSFVEYPHNTITILPKPNRLAIFPGFLVHRVKPYFGDRPRTSIVMGWCVDDPAYNQSIVI